MTMTFPDRITIWTNTGRAVAGGPVFAAPVQKNARWEDKQIQFIDAKGVMSVSRSVVYLEDTDVAVGDWLYKGESVAGSPPAGSHSTRQFDKVADLRKIRYERKAIL